MAHSHSLPHSYRISPSTFPLFNKPIVIDASCSSTEGGSLLITSDLIGAGSSAEVYYGQYAYISKNTHHRKEIDVAVKVFPETYPKAAVQEEARHLVRMHHSPYVLKFIGYHCEVSGSLLITELLKNSLDDILDKGPLTGFNLLLMSSRIVASIEAIHEAKIIHRDIKPSNIFLDANYQPKLADFGYSTTLGRITYPAGTPAFMAPELKEESPATTQIDIYSLGVLLITMSHGIASIENEEKLKKMSELFQSENHSTTDIMKLIQAKNVDDWKVIQKPEQNIPWEFLSLLRKCTCLDPAKRPTAEEARVSLDVLIVRQNSLKMSEAKISTRDTSALIDEKTIIAIKTRIESPSVVRKFFTAPLTRLGRSEQPMREYKKLTPP